MLAQRLFSVLTIFVTVKNANCAFFPLTVKDRIVVESVFRAETAKDWLECLGWCSADRSCVAYNYVSLGEKTGQCELSLCGVQAGCLGDKGTIDIRGHLMQQIRPSQVNRGISR